MNIKESFYKFTVLSLMVIILLNFGCGDKMPLPAVLNSPDYFGASDTTYNRLNPAWDAIALGYNSPNPMRPVDIAIGDDSYIFVADNANDRIITLTTSGYVATHQNLNKIFPVEKPLGVAIDAKLNLLIVNGSNKVYVWNQYLNNIGVDAVIVGVAPDSSLLFSNSSNIIDSVLAINTFYNDDDPNSSFQGVTFGPKADNSVFLTDKANNRIAHLEIEITGGVLLKNGRLHPIFSGRFVENIAEFGSGAGTVDNPRGITCDENGNIYFTQLGGNFSVQKLKKQGDSYIPGYVLYEHPIMDLERFAGPMDIALGNDDDIFIIDTADSGRVSKFYNKGSNAGFQANLGRTGLVNARFTDGQGIAFSNQLIVYVADAEANRIERYKYSVSATDLPVEQP
jgi:hypothetical protein